jgi:MFS family permease
MSATGPHSPQRQLLRNRAFVRLWIAGICSNSMRWLEILASSLYVFAATGSALAVAVVTMMRAVPMLAAGALAGVVAEGMNRKHLLHFGQALNAVTSAIIVLAALMGRLEIWLLALGSLANGLVWATEMAVRRRMAGEAAGETLVAPAIAIDSMSNSITRMIGPILGGLAYEMVGIAGAYAIGMAGYTLGLVSCLRLDHSQTVQPIRLRAVPGAISEAARICRGHAVLRRIIVLTIVMNVFGFSYTTVFPAWGQQVFGASPAMIGLLAGAEPLGALFGAWMIATRKLPVAAATVFLGGSTMFMALLAVAANLPVFALAWILLAVGGLGTAAFGSMQTALVILNVQPEARSRVLGLVTTSIGLGPLGVLAIGALSDAIGPPAALTVMGGIGAVLAVALRGAPQR